MTKTITITLLLLAAACTGTAPPETSRTETGAIIG